MTPMTLDASTARLTLSTGVEGKASRLGHDLVLVLEDWSAAAELDGQTPTAATLTARVASLRVESGTGGAKPLSDKDRQTIRENALEALKADVHPNVTFTSNEITQVAGGFALAGTLSIAGTSRPVVVDLRVAPEGASVTMAARVPVVQTEYGVKPYSAMLGALRLRDEVEVGLAGTVALPA